MAEGKIGFGFTLGIILIKGTLISTTSGDVQFSGVIVKCFTFIWEVYSVCLSQVVQST